MFQLILYLRLGFRFYNKVYTCHEMSNVYCSNVGVFLEYFVYNQGKVSTTLILYLLYYQRGSDGHRVKESKG